MSRAFSALLWKERREVGNAVWLAPVFAAVLFYEWMPEITADGLTDPVGRGKWGVFLLMALASTIGYQQTLRESTRDMWSFAFHRPVTPSEIFVAKLLAGAVPLFVSTLVAGTLAMWAVSAARDLPPSARWAYWPGAIADSISILGYYAAGLNLGAPGGRGARGFVGMGPPIICTFIVVVSQESNQLAGIAAIVTLTFVVTAMAWMSFTNGAELAADELKVAAGGRS
jgi:hypothetical protein